MKNVYCKRTNLNPGGVQIEYIDVKQLTHMGVVQKSFHFFPGLSQDLREAFASSRAWGFTTVGENGFSLGLEAFKDSCSCPGTSCVL